MKTVTTYTDDLLKMRVGESIMVAFKKRPGYATTASILKREGKGEWTSTRQGKQLKIERTQ